MRISDWSSDVCSSDLPLTGEISDYFGGLEDLESRRVRFIGNAGDRIDEDHLRIMRYFRFLARFGIADPDAEAYRTCIAKAHSLMALSRERIADELLRSDEHPSELQSLMRSPYAVF